MEVSLGNGFVRTVLDLQANESQRVMAAVQRFMDDPDHPSLNFHPIRGDRSGRLHSFRASQELRVMVAREGGVHVILEAGHHDAIYERAGRVRFIASAAIGFVGLVEAGTAELPTTSTAAPQTVAAGPGVLDHWTTAELLEAGLSENLAGLVRGCATPESLIELDVEDTVLDQLLEMLEQSPVEWFAPSLDPGAAREERIRAAIVDHGALAGMSPLFTPEEVARLAAAPIEEWMVFLHPDQRSVVEQHYSGPARIRGSAGTGKTVVALHRAAALANRYPRDDAGLPILFTTFIKTLPPVFERLYDRLPTAVDGAVRFLNVDKLAYEVCAEAGDRPTLDPRAIDAAFATAWSTVVSAGTPIAGAGLTRNYVRDEITAVIKGRGINNLDEYLAVERTGRGTRFGEPLRRQVWRLRETWDAGMDNRDTVDFVDVLRRARDHARRRTEPKFRAAIIDEAQDLSLIGLQMIRALVNAGGADPPDGLLIVGDGAQRIYAGGFTLRQAGVEVRGRTTVLRTNYRNTGPIIRAAMAVAGDGAVDDLGDQFLRGEADADSLREGVRPALVTCDDEEAEIAAVVGQISGLVETGAISFGDTAVCVATNNQAKAFQAALAKYAIPSIDLAKYDGTPTNKVKVGTHHRAKGLEFKVVFLPGLGAADFPRPQADGQSDEEYADAVSLAMSQLFVAMTRARDGLFLFASGEPSPAVARAEASFEVV